MTTASIRAAIEAVAPSYGIDPNILEALVITESGGNPYAFRPETTYRYLVNVRTGLPFRSLTPEERVSASAPLDFPSLEGSRDQEWQGQRTSWGLCQLMGAVARELGYRAPYLDQLSEVMTNLKLGCQLLGGHLQWARGNVDHALGAYNAGRGGYASTAGQLYATKVRANLAQVTSTTRRA